MGVVNGFSGSSIWHLLYEFPPVDDAMIAAGFELFAERFHPILDVFAECGVQFALEVHPTEIAFDLVTAERALAALDRARSLGSTSIPVICYGRESTPWNSCAAFPDRIYHVHVKDAVVHLNGRSGILGSHLAFGDPRRGWDFRSPGRGSVNFEEIIRGSTRSNTPARYRSNGKTPGWIAKPHKEACQFVQQLDFAPNGAAFDAAFSEA